MIDERVQAAKAALKANDIDRILCIYLSTEDSNVDWNKAKTLFGSSAETKVFKYKSKKALEDLEKAFRGQAEDLPGTPPESPASRNKVLKRRRRSAKTKRKPKSEDTEESEEVQLDDLGF